MSLKKLASLIVKINANGAQAQAEFRKLEKSAQEFGQSMQRVGKDMSKYVTVPLTAMAALSVNAANTQLQAEARLLTALKGREDVQKRLIKQAGELQSRSLYGDEVIIEQQAYLAALGMSEQQINDTIEAAAQLAAALGMDLNSAVRNLAKTYSGMTGELGESVPALRELTAEELKAGAAIEYVNENYKGFAETAAETGTGPLVWIKNKLGDLAEKVGTILLPILDKLVALISYFVDWLNQLPQPVQEMIVYIGTAVAAIGPLLTIVGSLIGKFGAIASAIPKVGTALLALARSPITITVAAIGTLITALATFESKAERARKAALKMEEFREAGRVENEDYFYNLTMDMYNRPSVSDEELQKLKNEYQSWIDAEANLDSKRNFQAQLRAINDIILQRMRAVEDEAASQRKLNKETQAAVGIIGKLQEQIKALEDKKLLATSKEEIGEINLQLAELNKQLDEIKDYDPTKVVTKLDPIATKPLTFGVSGPKMAPLEKSLNIEEWKKKFLTMSDEMVGLVNSLNSALSNAFASLASAMGEGIEAAITGDEFKPMQRLMLIIGDMLKQMGAALVAYATALEAFKEAWKNPWVALGAGLAAIAAGSVITGLAKRGLPKLAQGGLAYGPTIAVVGDNPGAVNDPEVVAPLSKLRNYMGGQKLELTGDIEWELHGDKLRALLNRENIRLSTLG